MVESYDVASGRWWRFDRYEIRDGHIRPAPGATVEDYDPWKDFREVRTKRLNTEPSYQSLMALIENIAFRPGEHGHPPSELTPESETSILGWCADHGLLGIRSASTDCSCN